MALRSGVTFLRSISLRQNYRLLSIKVDPDGNQNADKLASFPGAKAPYTTEMKFLNESSYDPIPIYRVIDNNGDVIEAKEEPSLGKDELVNMYKTMAQLSQMDKILYESQRQGRISFYMTNYGEEGAQVGSAAALKPQDMLYLQYREVGVLLYRGVTVSELIDQCYGNCDDPGKGRMMPVHYQSRLKNIPTISSPLATQMPQAVGAAYAFKRQPNNDRCVICYFGEGAASEGDAHAAFNFAATLDCPVIFFCRNNGYAISTPSREQYRGDGIAARGPALGIHTLRVDGTDALAVYNAVKASREYALGNNKPVLIEAMGYRVSHHSTSDDSTAYRAAEEIQKWTKEESPIAKFKLYLEKKGLWSTEEDQQFAKEARDLVLRNSQEAERKLKPHWREMLEDVYHITPPNLHNQMQQMESHLKKYKEHYPLDQFKSD